jgi:hypothetical protein
MSVKPGEKNFRMQWNRMILLLQLPSINPTSRLREMLRAISRREPYKHQIPVLIIVFKLHLVLFIFVCSIQEPVFGYSIEILGSQTLDDLCTKLKCQTDYFVAEEYAFPNISPVASKAFESCRKDLAMVSEAHSSYQF